VSPSLAFTYSEWIRAAGTQTNDRYVMMRDSAVFGVISSFAKIRHRHNDEVKCVRVQVIDRLSWNGQAIGRRRKVDCSMN
jgi:hypothetical protein